MMRSLCDCFTRKKRIQLRIQDFGQGGPGFLTPKGEGPEPTICSKWGVSLKIALKLHDLKKSWEPGSPESARGI